MTTLPCHSKNLLECRRWDRKILAHISQDQIRVNRFHFVTRKLEQQVRSWLTIGPPGAGIRLFQQQFICSFALIAPGFQSEVHVLTVSKDVWGCALLFCLTWFDNAISPRRVSLYLIKQIRQLRFVHFIHSVLSNLGFFSTDFWQVDSVNLPMS